MATESTSSNRRNADEAARAIILSALNSHHVGGVPPVVGWKDTAFDYVRSELGITTAEACEELVVFLENKNDLIAVDEKNPGFEQTVFYELEIRIRRHLAYFKMVILSDDPDDPVIKVVSAHPQVR